MVRVSPHTLCPQYSREQKRVKDQKVGEGTYAVVYRGSYKLLVSSPLRVSINIRPTLRPSSGRELATGRKIAIKKIKVGQFKDGLDMSAVREVKYLRELHHPNIIEVRIYIYIYILSRVLHTKRRSFACQTARPPP